MTYLVLPYHSIAHHAISCYTIPCFTISYVLSLPYIIISYHTTLYTIWSIPYGPYHTVHTMLYHIILYHIYHTIHMHNTMQCNAMHFISMQYHTKLCLTTLYHTFLYKRTFIFILLEQYKLKDYCSKIFSFWNCEKTLPRIPSDVFSASGYVG
jgi:hypothetical protein